MSLFGSSGVCGPVGDDVTAKTALSFGRAAGSAYDGTVVVGRDGRPSGEWLTPALVSGLRECGADVVDVGRVATPTLARSVQWQDAAAGIMVTPVDDTPGHNGFRFWAASADGVGPERRRELTDRVCAQQYDLQSGDEAGSVREVDDATATHRRALRRAVDPVDSLNVVVETGGEAGNLTASALRSLGCSVRSVGSRPDGTFPPRESDPVAECSRPLADYVGRTDTDLGIAHDADADRTMAVTESGRCVPGDVLLAVFARETAGRGDRVAVPVDASLAVDEAVASVGASVTRTQVGTPHVAAETTADDVVFGGDPAGGWIWPGETYCPDGPLAACRLAALVDREGSLDARVDDVARYPLRKRTVETEGTTAVVQDVRRHVGGGADDVRVTTTDGVRVDEEDGWFLVREHGSQASVHITAEAQSDARADQLLATASSLVERACD